MYKLSFLLENLKSLYVNADALNKELEKLLLFDFSKNASNAEEKSESSYHADFWITLDVTPYLIRKFYHRSFKKIKSYRDLKNMKKIIEAKIVAISRSWFYTVSIFEEDKKIVMEISCSKVANPMASLGIRSSCKYDLSKAI